MSTITNTATFAIGESTPTVETAAIVVLPIASPGDGTGRLIHPTLGTFDYETKPDLWRGFRGDIVVAPIWSSETTLAGTVNTLWDGSVEDVVVEETWVDLAMTTGFLATLLTLWTSPPNPALGVPTGFVKWFPSYDNDLGFYVIILGVEVGGQGVGMTPVVDQGWIEGPVTIRMRIVARVS